MENPFFRNFVKSSSRPRFFHTPTAAESPRGIPVHQPTTETAKPPKVVSIPVHFVGSEAMRSTAARRIQRVFRGYRVRKNVKKIVGIKKEVDEIEKKISLKEMVDLVRNDTKERLKVNEMLMGLLFKLDSVGGVDSGVRDARRAVIKKAIVLQERLDAIVSGDRENGLSDSVVEEAVNSVQDQVEERSSGAAEILEGEVEIKEKNAPEEEVLNRENVEDQSSRKEEEDKEDKVVDKKEEQEEGAMEIEQSDVIQGIEEEGAHKLELEEKEMHKDANGKELMKKMIERNEMLIAMMADLCERNAMQSQLINSLSNRVDNVEKALSKSKKRRKIPQRKCPVT